MRKMLVIISLVLSMQGLLLAMQPLQKKAEGAASNFTLSDLTGRSVSLSDYKDKPVILFFWTTWCPHCRTQLKALNNEQEVMLKDGIEIMAIDISEPSYKVSNFLEKNNLNITVLLDKDAEVAEQYDILGVPTVMIIDKNGDIVFRDNYFPRDYKSFL